MNQEMDRTKYNKLKERKETINKNSDLINQLVDEVVRNYAGELDEYIERVTRLIKNNPNKISDDDVEKMTLKIPLFLYSAASGLESLGVDGDIAKAAKQEVLNEAYMKVEGTIQDKTKFAELQSQKEMLIEIVYSRAYKKLKLKIETANSIYSGVKKVMSKRIAELELSKLDRNNKSSEDWSA